jgi:hypothetical protein
VIFFVFFFLCLDTRSSGKGGWPTFEMVTVVGDQKQEESTKTIPTWFRVGHIHEEEIVVLQKNRESSYLGYNLRGGGLAHGLVVELDGIHHFVVLGRELAQHGPVALILLAQAWYLLLCGCQLHSFVHQQHVDQNSPSQRSIGFVHL